MSLSVSVVIPLYNHEAYIASTLMSVTSQSLPAKQIIVIDDGSRDGGPEIVRQMQRSRPEIIFWGHPNRGAHNTINLGLARSTCDLVAVLNSDDIFEPRRFELAARVFAENSSVDVVMTGMSFIDGAGAEMPNAWYEEAMAFHRSSNDLGLTLINANIFMTTSNLIIRRRVLDEIGVFSNLRYAHDLDFMLRLVCEKRTIRVLDQKLLRYRIHASNTIAEGALKVKAEWAVVTAFYLSRVMLGPDGPEKLAACLPILRKHTLTDAVLLLLAYFMRNPSRTLERSPYLTDLALQQRVRDLLA